MKDATSKGFPSFSSGQNALDSLSLHYEKLGLGQQTETSGARTLLTKDSSSLGLHKDHKQSIGTRAQGHCLLPFLLLLKMQSSLHNHLWGSTASFFFAFFFFFKAEHRATSIQKTKPTQIHPSEMKKKNQSMESNWAQKMRINTANHISKLSSPFPPQYTGNGKAWKGLLESVFSQGRVWYKGINKNWLRWSFLLFCTGCYAAPTKYRRYHWALQKWCHHFDVPVQLKKHHSLVCLDLLFYTAKGPSSEPHVLENPEFPSLHSITSLFTHSWSSTIGPQVSIKTEGSGLLSHMSFLLRTTEPNKKDLKPVGFYSHMAQLCE